MSAHCLGFALALVSAALMWAAVIVIACALFW